MGTGIAPSIKNVSGVAAAAKVIQDLNGGAAETSLLTILNSANADSAIEKALLNSVHHGLPEWDGSLSAFHRLANDRVNNKTAAEAACHDAEGKAARTAIRCVRYGVDLENDQNLKQSLLTYMEAVSDLHENRDVKNFVLESFAAEQLAPAIGKEKAAGILNLAENLYKARMDEPTISNNNYLPKGPSVGNSSHSLSM